MSSYITLVIAYVAGGIFGAILGKQLHRWRHPK